MEDVCIVLKALGGGVGNSKYRGHRKSRETQFDAFSWLGLLPSDSKHSSQQNQN